MTVHYSPAAEARLGQIWDYSLATWGDSQADRYVRELMGFIRQLPKHRARWKPFKDKELKGIWFLRHRHHVVFFRQLDAKALGVITILHAQMDLPLRLLEELDGME